MQVPDDEKRSAIVNAAAELFATQLFHKVKLSDVAARAAVGKGTVYTYFKDKEDLYLSVFYVGFVKLLDSIRQKVCVQTGKPVENLGHVIREIVAFAYANPHVYQVMRRIGTGYGDMPEKWQKWKEKRTELQEILEAIIVKGVETGLFHSPNPKLATWVIPGIIRSAVINGSHTMGQEELAGEILAFVRSALSTPQEQRKGVL